MKKYIKMRVNYEQSKRVQEICFENGLSWMCSSTDIQYLEISAYLIIFDYHIAFKESHEEKEYLKCNQLEIDADLFIRTNGTCEENDLVGIGAIDYYSKNIQLKKKIDNLHIALNKKVEKNKLQASEITLLLKQKEDLNNKLNQALIENKRIYDFSLEEIKTNEDNNVNLNREIDRLNFIIKYLEQKCKLN